MILNIWWGECYSECLACYQDHFNVSGIYLTTVTFKIHAPERTVVNSCFQFHSSLRRLWPSCFNQWEPRIFYLATWMKIFKAKSVFKKALKKAALVRFFKHFKIELLVRTRARASSTWWKASIFTGLPTLGNSGNFSMQIWHFYCLPLYYC